MGGVLGVEEETPRARPQFEEDLRDRLRERDFQAAVCVHDSDSDEPKEGAVPGTKYRGTMVRRRSVLKPANENRTVEWATRVVGGKRTPSGGFVFRIGRVDVYSDGEDFDSDFEASDEAAGSKQLVPDPGFDEFVIETRADAFWADRAIGERGYLGTDRSWVHDNHRGEFGGWPVQLIGWLIKGGTSCRARVFREHGVALWDFLGLFAHRGATRTMIEYAGLHLRACVPLVAEAVRRGGYDLFGASCICSVSIGYNVPFYLACDATSSPYSETVLDAMAQIARASPAVWRSAIRAPHGFGDADSPWKWFASSYARGDHDDPKYKSIWTRDAITIGTAAWFLEDCDRDYAAMPSEAEARAAYERAHVIGKKWVRRAERG